jgi:transcriptional regulator with XRE-family HTH domain
MLDFALNLRRLMARSGMTLEQVVDATGLNERTVKSILSGKNKPHARTLHRLATGLGVETDELFQNPSLLAHRLFDRRTNPLVEDVVSSRPELFTDWTEADFPLSYHRISSVLNVGAAVAIETLLLRTLWFVVARQQLVFDPFGNFKIRHGPRIFLADVSVGRRPGFVQ